MARRKKIVESEPVPEVVQVEKSATVNEMAGCVVNNPELVRQMETLGFKSRNPGGMTYKELIIASQIANAVKGDINSYRAVMDYAEKENESSPLFDFIKCNFGE